MSVLQVGNLHFESTGNNRLQYTGSNSYLIVGGGATIATINSTSFYANGNFDVAGTFKVANADISTIGQHTIWIPATAMTPATTNGAAFGSLETTTNKITTTYLAFDSSAQEHAQFAIQMPKSWNEGTLISQFVWTHPAAAAFGVTWGIQAVAMANNDALDTAWGTSVLTTHTGGTTNYTYISAETSAFTVGNTPSAEELVYYRVFRQAANTGDTMAVDAYLIGVKIHYTVDAGRDD